ncbi:MAG TPA: calcium-binding protein [Caulobacteraceae bacterium]|jgi:Ca2+-binding RTX toxin-like protein
MPQYIGTSGNDSLSGSDGADFIKGLDGNDSLWGAEGFDVVRGGRGADLIDDSLGGDSLYGGSGVDVLGMFYGTFFGGGIGAFDFTFVSGAETVTPYGSTARGFERINITGSDGDDTITGGARADTVRGWQGDDWLDGGKGTDFLIGDNGADTLNGGGGNDLLSGGGHDDVLYGGAGADTLVGGSNSDLYSGDDTLSGGAGADLIRIGPDLTTILYASSSEGVYVDVIQNVGFGGEAQGDTFEWGSSFGSANLIGSAFDDFLIGAQWMDGGAGDDRLEARYATRGMTGGEGLDRFIITFDTEILYDRTLINDFDQPAGEKIDLSPIDAAPRAGYQAFTFIGTDAFTGEAGEVRYQLTGDGRTAIELSVDKNAEAEHTIYLAGEYVLTAADFML